MELPFQRQKVLLSHKARLLLAEMKYIQLITCSASMIIEDAGGRLC